MKNFLQWTCCFLLIILAFPAAAGLGAAIVYFDWRPALALPAWLVAYWAYVKWVEKTS
jgi:hypothetical protein